MSTVISTSAGERAPSALTRSSRPSLTNTVLTLRRRLRGEGGEQGLDQAGLARGVEREFVGGRGGQGGEQAQAVAARQGGARGARSGGHEKGLLKVMSSARATVAVRCE